MEKIKLGKTDLKVARINFGGNVLGWTLDEKQSFEILDAFTVAGFNFIDTADTYSWWMDGNVGGESEKIIGKWMKARGNREKIVLATKVGSANREHNTDISRAHILKSVDESLRRLQTDHIDLYYTHFDDGITPVEETLSAYSEVIKAGKVGYIGASNISPARLKESLDLSQKKGLPQYQVLQPLYNLLERSNYETKYAPIVEKYDLSVLTYYSLASGFLTGKYRTLEDSSKSARGSDAVKYLTDKGLCILNALDEISAKHNTKPSSIALAWLLAQPHVAAPIVSATNKEQLETLFAAPELNLDKEDLVLLNNASK